MGAEKLGNIADVFSGQIMSRVSAEKLGDVEPAGEINVIVPKAITSEGTILKEELTTEKLAAYPDARRITKEGDIIIKLSTPFDSATITRDFADCLVPSFCAIIRPFSERYDKDYLQAFLNSELCKEQMRAMVSGAVMTILSVGKLKEVEIPYASMEVQMAIGARYRKTQEDVQIFKEIISLEKKRNDAVFFEMVD